jgi:glycosyltransferase involved in cell wall biosynthesis
MKKQNILLISRSLKMGGIERNTINLAESITKLGHDVHILYFKHKPEITIPKNILIHHYNFEKLFLLTGVGLIYELFCRSVMRLIFPNLSFIWRGLYGGIFVKWKIKSLEKKYSIFDKIIIRGQGGFEHIWNYNDPRLYLVIVCPFDAIKPNSRTDKWQNRFLFKNKNLIANSSGVFKKLQKKLHLYKINVNSFRIIHNPCPIAKYQKLSLEKIKPPVDEFIIQVGRLTYQKNQALLLQAYQLSETKIPLVIVGSDRDNGKTLLKLKNLSKELGISDRVFFIGEKQNPYPWMRAARLFVLSSVYEGFGLVNVESLACGTPVVATDCPGGIRDILIEEQENYIAKNNAEDLAKKINFALKNPIKIKNHWFNRFDATNISQQFLKLK